MSTDHLEASASTSRRTFLTRAALGGALLTAGSLAAPLDQLASVAGARTLADSGVDNETFAEFATPLEMAAVQAYQAAFSGGTFSTEDAARLLSFQGHHQAVVDTLTPLIPEGAARPTADPDLQSRFTEQVRSSTDPKDIVTTLSELENVLSSTHLWAIGVLTDSSTAKLVAQVLAVEAQQSALLAITGGGSIAAATPQLATTDDAITPAGN